MSILIEGALWKAEGEARHAEEEDREGEDRPAAEPVGERAEDEGADHQSEDPGPEQRRELRRRRAPFGPEGWRDEPDGDGVEAVHGDDEEAEDEEQDLDQGQSSCVDEPLDVDRVDGCHDHSLRPDSVCDLSESAVRTKHVPFFSSATGQSGSSRAPLTRQKTTPRGPSAWHAAPLPSDVRALTLGGGEGVGREICVSLPPVGEHQSDIGRWVGQRPAVAESRSTRSGLLMKGRPKCDQVGVASRQSAAPLSPWCSRSCRSAGRGTPCGTSARVIGYAEVVEAERQPVQDVQVPVQDVQVRKPEACRVDRRQR